MTTYHQKTRLPDPKQRTMLIKRSLRKRPDPANVDFLDGGDSGASWGLLEIGIALQVQLGMVFVLKSNVHILDVMVW